jgi:hypothetical protein
MIETAEPLPLNVRGPPPMGGQPASLLRDISKWVLFPGLPGRSMRMIIAQVCDRFLRTVNKSW